MLVGICVFGRVVFSILHMSGGVVILAFVKESVYCILAKKPYVIKLISSSVAFVQKSYLSVV